MAEVAKPNIESQANFRGGANAVTEPALLRQDEVQRLINGFAMAGGGVEARRGYKHFGTDTNRGVGVWEFEQSVGTVLTFVAIGASYYDESMSPYAELFQQTPGAGDIVYFGSRERSSVLILNTSDMPITPGAGNTFVHEWWNGSIWVDETAGVVENVANAKQMQGVPGVWILVYPEHLAWVPHQVETRTYQFWRRIRCTAGGVDMGTNITQSQQLVTGDWVGRRHLMTAFTQGITEWPGLTLTPRNVDIYNESTNRVRTAEINDHLYIASDGQKPLRRWNGCRGSTRAGTSQVVANAGLVVPAVAPVLTPTANPNAYPLTYTLGYVIAFEHGPESKLGESRPSPIAYVAPQAAAYQVKVDYAAAKAQAATLAVNAIRVYATYDLSGKLVSERGSLSNYLLIKRVVRGDANWNAGFFQDTFLERVKVGQRNPILYDTSPPFYPKYIAVGGERLWIANDHQVAWSDVGRGDSWDPANIKNFPSVRGLFYWGNRMLVFENDDISYIGSVNQQLPDIGYFWRGLGLAQPDTLACGEGQLHFISNEGPARIIGNAVELTGRSRAWEDDNFWATGAPNRNLAAAAYFEARVWFGIDRAGDGPGLTKMAAYDVGTDGTFGWSEHDFANFSFGVLANVHCPLDHANARKRILLGFPDGAATADYRKLTMLEYGTTDAWTNNPWDGTHIQTVVIPREMTMGAADRVKEYYQAHLKLRQYAAPGGSGTRHTQMHLIGSSAESGSTLLEIDASVLDEDQEWTFKPTDAGGGSHRGHGSAFTIVGVSDNGWKLISWLVRATMDDWRPGP